MNWKNPSHPFAFFVVLLLFALASFADDVPAYRIDASGFGNAKEPDIRALLDSAVGELWKHFPDCTIEAFVVMRGNEPMVAFKRNRKSEIVMTLATQDKFWSQYTYQFSHEFCHILCGYRDDDPTNKWFEETLCETAALYTLRAMAKTWQKRPPYPHWKSYGKSLRSYADDIIKGREKISDKKLASFYEKHREDMEKSSSNRALNGAMAIVLLGEFERDPSRWESVRWLNAIPAEKKMSFHDYLLKWRNAAPPKHHSFISKLASRFGITLPDAPQR